jgi:hypothetical protein
MTGLPLYAQTGFDYIAAIRELNQLFSYDQIAERIGYASKGSITKVMAGAMPGHVQGESLWALYVDTFGRKPPLVRQGAPTD